MMCCYANGLLHRRVGGPRTQAGLWPSSTASMTVINGLRGANGLVHRQTGGPRTQAYRRPAHPGLSMALSPV